ncbi:MULTISPECIES: competence type IV pilus minor pilin ComGG [unclassified Bacillus (in: firmicutes)]|uniref:competence type IV pilus minor pilin ComGG n=1 Tax=unclassified Bacillus (in: firmicutes) TaxID=185979 RepID=UPI00228035D7|nr:ComGG family competence protein [Bacillus sp. S20C3]MCY8205109.1 ComGG family competence protein [Bacillus sp. N12A5]MCY8289526.1 ComGG family competence protein [Bacillus sp. N13C7]MCY8638013.1 ComGG family competence protein [Bacillus sp. S17B2]MCY8719081.1 ComGG family competence protein [Bacillus sp. S10C12M]MCY9144220.1 ComGG family competence protein [Bacillus sp. T9C1]
MYSSKGFIYPAVLFVSALMLLIVNFTAAQYMSRCMFEKETKELYTGENLLQNGALLSIRHVLEKRKGGQHGSQQFAYGKVSYHIYDTSIKEQKEISLKASTESGTERTAQLVFDQKRKKLLSWTE